MATKARVDSQITALAGELFVAAELLKRGIQTSVTFGNAKAIDLLAYNPFTKTNFTVQVKSLRSDNYYLLRHSDVDPTHMYVFVLLGKLGTAVRYFVVRGEELASSPDKFKTAFLAQTMPGIRPKTLAELGYENAWNFFGHTVA